MKNIGIHEPCSENWNEMTPTEQGAFCQKCATQVYDFTTKSNDEIKQTLRSLIGQPVCGSFKPGQEAALNAEFERWMFRSERSFQSAFLLSLLVVFGLTLFSCSTKQDEEQISRIRNSAIHAIKQQPEETVKQAEIVEAIAPVKAREQENPVVYDRDVVLVQYDQEQVSQPDVTGYVLLNNDSYRMGGAVMMTSDYQQFLVADVEYTLPVELDENGVPYPSSFESKVFPNPATTETTFELSLPNTGLYDIHLYDMSGKHLSVIHSGEIARGTFRQQLDLTDLNAGIYLVIIHSEFYKETVRISKI